ncbi:copper chaperone PCu(A)C [Sphingomonas sinipercae]|uniref:Copper chaperone PCu(A)C n=1 Tax=Sphingomonas sinipercae TaxID=2714944 RepID=A0A6G7ZMD9_9SPHN|nr:copper chaperone PCu(A)C [Sphingomonas sinipercae]QIL02092.1 copper chaperone PCu(A)C [Sphingomonas sinipercae]
MLLFLLASCSAPDAAPEIEVRDAWVRATQDGQASTAAYLTLTNRGGADALVEVAASDGAASMHSTSMAGGIMRMRPLARVELQHGATAQFRPGGDHIMITGLKQPLTIGQPFTLRLRFERGAELSIALPVKDAAGAAM